MKFSNYHTHSHYCDGNGILEDYVKMAIMHRLKGIGFSSHAPVPFKSNWNMPMINLPKYLGEIEELKLKYSEDVNVFCSLEVDYIKDIIGPKSKIFSDANLDYIIGSVHYLGKLEDGRYWTIDGNQKDFDKGYRELYNYDNKKLVRHFYETQKEMIQNECPDIIAHIDRIKIQNNIFQLFNESDTWYKKEVLELLDLVKQKDCIVEINTKTFLRKDELFPGKNWFEIIHKMNIPIVLNSDSHYPKNLTDGFSQVIPLLKEVGYKGQFILKNAGWEFEKWQ